MTAQSVSSRAEYLLQQGHTVELRTGFVLSEGSLAEQQLRDGYQMWLEFSGAGGGESTGGFSVGKGTVRINHSTEYATAGETCDSYHAAARRLIEKEVGTAKYCTRRGGSSGPTPASC